MKFHTNVQKCLVKYILQYFVVLFTILKLFKDFICTQYVCGTLRINRRNFRCITSKKLKQGEVIGKQNSDCIEVTKWKDK